MKKAVILALISFLLLLVTSLFLVSICMWGCPNSGIPLILKSCVFVLTLLFFYQIYLVFLKYKKPNIPKTINNNQNIKAEENSSEFGFLLTIAAFILNPIVIVFGLIGLLGGQFFLALLIFPPVFYFIGLRSPVINFIGLALNAILLVAAIYQGYLYSAYTNEYIAGLYLMAIAILATAAICNLLALWSKNELITKWSI